MIRIAVAGAAGHMGREIIRAVLAEPSTSLSTAIEYPQSNFIGQDAGNVAGTEECGIAITTLENIADFDVMIDFSLPAATIEHACHCVFRGKGMVIGVTGFSDEEKTKIQTTAEKIALVMAPNMSIGVCALLALAENAARLLNAGRLGGGYDMEVFEAHHRRKKDAPSGTALRLGEVLASATGTTLKEDAAYDRQGQRAPNAIGFSVVRGGDIIGEHRVIFAGDGEQLELVHRSTSRANYAAGAVRAAKFAATAKNGLYDMTSVLNIAAE